MKPNILSIPGLRILGVAGVIVFATGAFGQFGGFGLDKVVDGVKGATKVSKGLAGFSEKEELNAGGSLAIEIAAQRGGILKDVALTKRVATLGKAMVIYCHRSHLPWTFMVLDNPSINAFSGPGGYVFVTKGLMDSCTSDRELAGMLAHEISHITERHALKLISGKEGLAGAASLVSASGYGSGFDDWIEKGMSKFLDKGLGDDAEYEADLFGTKLLEDVGFPPKTLRDYLTKVGARKSEKMFSTHPDTGDRVEHLDKYLNEGKD